MDRYRECVIDVTHTHTCTYTLPPCHNVSYIAADFRTKSNFISSQEFILFTYKGSLKKLAYRKDVAQDINSRGYPAMDYNAVC